MSLHAVRIGLLRLTDAAPVVVADRRGLFRQAGLEATLSVEPSWANVADKLAYGLLDAAVMLPPLAIAASLGLRGPRAELVVPMGLSRGGISLTLAARPAAVLQPGTGDALAKGRAFGAWLAARRRSGTRPCLAVVHLFSGHNLLLRYWLAASGVDPERDLDLVVLPPAEMGAALQAGAIDGFCSGAPWGALAERQGIGRVVLHGSEVWRGHPEKVLAVRRAWAEQQPDLLSALLRALVEACRLCDDPAEAEAIAALLAGPDLVNAEAAAIATSLGGPDLPGRRDADRIVFHAGGATLPWISQAAWFAGQMRRWGWLSDAQAAQATALYRPELYRAALRGRPDPVPASLFRHEGAHAGPWVLQTEAGPLPMPADGFCDGTLFDEQGRPVPVS